MTMQTHKDQDNCVHTRFQVRNTCPDCGKELGYHEFTRSELSAQELNEQQVAELPNREAMSLINANIAAPINAALALNVLSDGSIATATATQSAPITQGT